ncbi:MAG: hypothetical protein LUG13_01175 [Oscillospiraceae bacterium]|nr:hypothetical protein [Oscillospiraceae bacterium]
MKRRGCILAGLVLLFSLTLFGCSSTDNGEEAPASESPATESAEVGQEIEESAMPEETAAQPDEGEEAAQSEAPSAQPSAQVKSSSATTSSAAVSAKQSATAAPSNAPIEQAATDTAEGSGEGSSADEDTAAQSPKSVAQGYVGRSVSSLAAAVGQPNSKSYASSCMGDGEDGMWYYSGFTVYTYRDTDGTETVQAVE